MVQRPFDTERAPSIPSAPYKDDSGYIVSLGGRIDNAPELLQDRGLQHARPHVPAALLDLYRHSGIQGAGRLVGEFIAVIWDPIEQRLVLLSDPLGRNALYYSITDDFVSWASRPRVLLEAGQVAGDLNPAYFADFLINNTSPATPYKSVQKVPGGHAVIVSATAESAERYWSVDPTRTITYKTDGEYEEHFVDLFTQAVGCRIQTAGPAFCELSGGLDSSSIACVAKTIGGRDHLNTAAYVFPHCSSSDESEYIRAVTEHLRAPHVDISDVECPLYAPLDEGLWLDFPTNDLPFMRRHDRLADLMWERGSRVVLNGMGGDQLFWSTPPLLMPLLDSIAQRNIPAVFRRAKECARISSAHFMIPLALALKWSLLHRSRVVWRKREEPSAAWLQPGFVKETDLISRAALLQNDAGFHLPSGAHQYSLIRQTMRDFALDRAFSGRRIEVRYPFLDQRLIEFALALPFEQSVRWPETRSIIRRSLKGFIPEKVLTRKSKAGPTEAMIRALIHQWPRILKDSSVLRVAEHGIVDSNRFMNAVNQARLGKVPHAAQLTATLSLELWLRSIEKKPSSAASTFRQRQSLLLTREANSRKEKAYEYN